MSEKTKELKLTAALEAYNKDRDEEKNQSNAINALFTAFTIVILGATNAYLQLPQKTIISWSIFSLSVFMATGVYWFLHVELQKRLRDISKIKEGREILIMMLVNSKPASEYRHRLVDDDAIELLEIGFKSPAFPFVSFNNIIKVQLPINEGIKRNLVIIMGMVVAVLTLAHNYEKEIVIWLGI